MFIGFFIGYAGKNGRWGKRGGGSSKNSPRQTIEQFFSKYQQKLESGDIKPIVVPPRPIPGTQEEISYAIEPKSVSFLKNYADEKGKQFLLDNNVTAVYNVNWGFYDKDFGGEIGTSLSISYFPPNISDRAKRRSLLVARQMWKEDIVPKLKDGTVLMNSPIPDNDGRGNTRADLYKRHGFGEINGVYQYAIVRNGKLEPVNGIRLGY